MLLEYNVDTVDEKMVDSAAELRKRVAIRKLDAAIQSGVVDGNVLLEMKELSRDERKAHMSESFDVSVAGIQGRIAVGRAEQQLLIEGKVRLLGRDVSRASRLGKSRTDALTDLEKRIISMRSQLKAPMVQPIEALISQDLRVSNRATLERKFEVCEKCHRRILVELMKTHSNMCNFVNGMEIDKSTVVPPIYSTTQDPITEIATFKPQAPRHCKVIAKGATFIHWAWEPPVIDGGLTVTEYEISYSVRITEFDKEIGKYKKWTENYTIATSHWVFVDNPVCNRGYKMVNLRAGAEYTNFKIRCRNLHGWCDWGEMLDPDDEQGHGLATGTSVLTSEPEAPSEPLFFQLDAVTSTTISISWRPPFFDGGSELVDYMVHYTVLERHVTVTSRDVIMEKTKKYSLSSATELSTVIRNVKDDTDVVNISVCAVNKAGLIGEKAFLKSLPPDLQKEQQEREKKQGLNKGKPKDAPAVIRKGPVVVRTRQSSRHTQLMREMAMCTASIEIYFDSAFLTGVRQRYLRVDYMKKISEELAITPTDALELQEIKEWAAVEEMQRIKKKEAEEAMRLAEEMAAKDNFDYGEQGDQAEDGKPKNFTFTFRQRRQHFKRKIAALEQRMVDLRKESDAIDRERTKGTFDMKSKEKQLLAFKLELERLKQYTGTTVTSDVLTGVDMQYKLADYRMRVDKAYDQRVQEIAKIKYKIMFGESRKQQIKLDLVKAEEDRKERMAKFLEFDLNYQKTLAALDRIRTLGAGNTEKTLSYFFEQLKINMNERKAQRQRVTDLFLRVIYRKKKGAFHKWASGKILTFESEKDLAISVGSLLLQQSLDKRKELQGLLRETIAETAVIKQKLFLANVAKDTKSKLMASKEFKLMDEGMNPQSMHYRGMHYLFEGDGYAIENRYKLAQEMYETQIWWLRSRPKLDIKLLAICHGRLGKMFLRLEKNNRAIVEFDRQLSLAREISDKVEEAESIYGLGTGYMRSFDYDNAIRYLTLAMGMMDAIGNGPKYCGVLHTLRECYDRVGKADQVRTFTEKIEAVEDDLRNKISAIHNKLDDMKGRLSNTAAEIEFVVKIERTTLQALALRKRAELGHEQLKDLEEEQALQEGVIAGMEKLLDAIAMELQEAIQSDELEMWSELVHETPQIVEIEELKQRLRDRSKQEVDRLMVEREKLRKIGVSISNTENNIQEADQQLVLEDGALMRHSRHDKPFRSVGLCAANAAGNEVTGTATGGFEEFVCAEGCNVHVIDCHSGELKHVFCGANVEAGGHEGVVTCLLHDGPIIFSGSTDETIIAWDTITRKRMYAFEGHEGSIVSLAAEEDVLASGSSDATVRLWNKRSTEQLRVLYGHSKSVLSLGIGATWLLTGSADQEVRVWKLFKKSKHTVKAECSFRMVGHRASVTCVSYGKMEILSGDVNGRIFIWWMATGAILRHCQVHKGPVKCMQFDAVHIVSGGVDNCVCITDIATGEVLQSLRGHEGHILALAFDTERILSVGGDNTIRYWQWGKKSGPQDKYHVLNKGETLLQVGKVYGITVADIMKWNGIVDLKQCYPGMKLLVKKGDPTVMSDAERAYAERERRQGEAMQLTSKKLKADESLGGDFPKYDRIHKLATDIDFYSLGNRLFGKEKRQLELFPDYVDPNADTRSLAARLRRTEEEIAEEGRSKVAAKMMTRYFVSGDNEDEWGAVSDQLAVAMLSLMVEYQAYEVVMEQKKALRNHQSVIGRVFAYQGVLAKEDAEKAKAIENGTMMEGEGDEATAASTEPAAMSPPKKKESPKKKQAPKKKEGADARSRSRKEKRRALDAIEEGALEESSDFAALPPLVPPMQDNTTAAAAAGGGSSGKRSGESGKFPPIS